LVVRGQSVEKENSSASKTGIFHGAFKPGSHFSTRHFHVLALIDVLQCGANTGLTDFSQSLWKLHSWGFHGLH
jgi:hypothetical protein